MTAFGASIIRTVVPALAGGISAWLLSKGIDLDTGAIVGVITPVLTGVFYAVIRWAEARVPWVGWLLGYKATITGYTTGNGSNL